MVNSIHASTTTATNKKKQAERMSQISSKCGSGFTYVRTNLMTCSQAPPHCVGSARALLHSISSWHDISFPFSGNRAYIRKPSPSFQVWWPITSCNNRFLCDLWYSLCLLSCFFFICLLLRHAVLWIQTWLKMLLGKAKYSQYAYSTPRVPYFFYKIVIT